MRTLNANDVIWVLKAQGFLFDRQAKGSHEIWYNPATRRRAVVPNHGSRDIPKPTLRSIIKQSGISPEGFS